MFVTSQRKGVYWCPQNKLQSWERMTGTSDELRLSKSKILWGMWAGSISQSFPYLRTIAGEAKFLQWKMHRKPGGLMCPWSEDVEVAVVTCKDQWPQTRLKGESPSGCQQGQLMTLKARWPPTWHFVDTVLEESWLGLIEIEFLPLDGTGAQNTN